MARTPKEPPEDKLAARAAQEQAAFVAKDREVSKLKSELAAEKAKTAELYRQLGSLEQSLETSRALRVVSPAEYKPRSRPASLAPATALALSCPPL